MNKSAKQTPEYKSTRWIPVPKWNDYYDWPPPGGIRHLIFNAEERVNSKGDVIPGNGFASAFKRVGRTVLIDDVEFWDIAIEKNHREGNEPSDPCTRATGQGGIISDDATAQLRTETIRPRKIAAPT